MAANIYLRRAPISIGSHDVQCEVMDFRISFTGHKEVLLKMSSTWLGSPDCEPDKQWVRIGETFTVTKEILVS